MPAAHIAMHRRQAKKFWLAFEKAKDEGREKEMFNLRGQEPQNANQLADLISVSMRDMMTCGVASMHG